MCTQAKSAWKKKLIINQLRLQTIPTTWLIVGSGCKTVPNWNPEFGKPIVHNISGNAGKLERTATNLVHVDYKIWARYEVNLMKRLKLLKSCLSTRDTNSGRCDNFLQCHHLLPGKLSCKLQQTSSSFNKLIANHKTLNLLQRKLYNTTLKVAQQWGHS